MSELNKEQESFLADFNWHNYAEGIDPIDADNLQEFEDLVTKTFISTSDEEVVEGVVVRITDRDVIVDINAKSEGVISLNEFCLVIHFCINRSRNWKREKEFILGLG